MNPKFLGDHLDRALPALPTPTALWGAIVVVYWFRSHIKIFNDGRLEDEEFNLTRWTDPPDARIDRLSVPASWSGWWYPLPEGPHRLEIRAPGATASVLNVNVAAGTTQRFLYRAEVTYHVDLQTDEVFDVSATGTLDAGH